MASQSRKTSWNRLDDLADVEVPNPTDGQVLTYNGTASQWDPQDNISALVDDTTPQLGGNLDVNGKTILATSGNLLKLQTSGAGAILVNGQMIIQQGSTGGSHYFRSGDSGETGTVSIILDGYSNGPNYGYLSFNDSTDVFTIGGASAARFDLGSDLNVNGQSLVSVSNGDITLTPNGTGKTVVTALEAPLPMNNQTGTTYSPVLADADKMITLNNAAAVTVTIPANSSVAFPIGTKLNFMQLGAGQVTIAITSDTLSFDTSLTTSLNDQYAVAHAIKIATTVWVLYGHLEPATYP